MGNRVCAEDIRRINEIYQQCKSYAETARRTGWSTATVRRYIKTEKPVDKTKIKVFDMNTDMPAEFSTQMFEGVANYGDLCKLDADEFSEMIGLWEEMDL